MTSSFDEPGVISVGGVETGEQLTMKAIIKKMPTQIEFNRKYLPIIL